jgi:hypothetical protein
MTRLASAIHIYAVDLSESKISAVLDNAMSEIRETARLLQCFVGDLQGQVC